MDLGGFLTRMESDYIRPTQQLLMQFHEKHPTATAIMAVFAMTSIIPVVSAIALALFASFLAVAGLLTTLVALGLSLLAILSSTLVFSVASTVLVSSFIRSRKASVQTGDGVPTEPTEAASTSSQNDPTHHAFTAFGHWYSKKGSTWSTRLFLFFLLRNTIARIFLPRWMRYHRMYPFFFGSDRTPHPFKWIILNSIEMVGRLVYPIILVIGSTAILVGCAYLLFTSQRVREIRIAALAALVAFLRQTLDSLEKNTTTTTGASAAEPHASPDAPATGTKTDETVPSVVPPGQTAGATAISTSGVAPEMRARNVTETA
ncbi:hypothetical protein MSAN_01918500 [Mycena sanguinolenta]|uniref:Uncharacterized protein n=1 Tax=Mycena sanguinolenta TaxID=230812 RepID=A0A8H6XQ92_9AGAR|nr:hypothetical protein MSAN_01918500 [Mycena sanguinolenta]